MRFDEIENIWTMDLSELSNADRGRVYFERAKQVVREALSDQAKRLQAVDGRRFRRSYLVEKIGCQPAVTTQNPKIKRLLVETDEQLASELEQAQGRGRPTPGAQSAEVAELRSTIDKLQRLVDVQAAEITDLRRQLREAGWPELELAGHGRLPW